MLKVNVKRILLFFIIAFVLFGNIAFAVDTDKMGRIIETITRPTAESTIDPDTISSALRRKTDVMGGIDSSKNINSSAILFDQNSGVLDIINNTSIVVPEENYTLIRHTPSISVVTGYSYELINDAAADRLKLKIKESGVGEWYAKNGFYKIDDKTYYFDENGLMVLGYAKDTIGNIYLFSYETGELLEEITS